MSTPPRLRELLRREPSWHTEEEKDLQRISEALVFDRDGITRDRDLPQRADVSVGLLQTRAYVGDRIHRAIDILRQDPAREHVFRFQLQEYHDADNTYYFLDDLRLEAVGRRFSVASSLREYGEGQGECHSHHQFLPEYWSALSPGDVYEFLNLPPWKEPNGLIRRDKRVSGIISVRSSRNITLQLYELDIARALQLLDKRSYEPFLSPQECVYLLGNPTQLL